MMADQPLSSTRTIGWLLDGWPVSKAALPSAIQTVAIANLVLDSREINRGDSFVALPGESGNGADYIDKAIANGATSVLLPSSSSGFSHEWRQKVPLVYIPGLTEYVSALAVRFYDNPSAKLPVIGVTGTNGKTTCAHVIAQIAAFSGRHCGVLGTLGYGVYLKCNGQQSQVDDIAMTTGSAYTLTTPDVLTIQANIQEMIDAGAECLVLEASSHGLVQGRVADVDINTAVFTNLTRDHLDYHGDMDSYGRAKAILFGMASVGKAVINIDDDFGRQLVSQFRNTRAIVTYSIDNTDADFYLTAIDYQDSGITAKLHSPFGIVGLSTKLLGQFNLSNLLATLATHINNSDQLEQVTSYAEKLKPVIGRMESIANHSDIEIIVDFAHTPDALEQTLAAVAKHCRGQLWCLFGCGGNRDTEKRPLMAAIAEQRADHIIVTSDNPRNEDPMAIIENICTGFSPNANYKIIEDRKLAINNAIEKMQPQDLLLIAGKGHENYQLIGNQKLPFSDQSHARMAVQRREQQHASGQ